MEVAINEKSRYVAERITSTEMARAWADGFWAKAQNSNDIVAVKFKLSSRHPVFDICDMYSKADMFGLGAGVFPKNKVPALLVHPHCLCRYVEVYADEVDVNKQRDTIRASGDEWLENLSDLRKRQVLGYDGLKAWQNGEDWRKYMRGYAGFREVKSRLQMYKIVELSTISTNDSYRTPYGSINEFKVRKIKNTIYDVYVSENVKMKPKMFAELNNQINECLELLGVDNNNKLPKILIASNKDLNNALGSYVAVDNKLYINQDVLERKNYEHYLDMQKNPVAKNRLITMLHELIHWQDAKKYIMRFGAINNQEEYLKYIIKKHKKKVDKLVEKEYNISKISSYALKMYFEHRYDEVMTEYRVMLLLRGDAV